MIWSVVILKGTPMTNAQAIIATKAMVSVKVVERSTPEPPGYNRCEQVVDAQRHRP